jgi:hypothetical protein
MKKMSDRKDSECGRALFKMKFQLFLSKGRDSKPGPTPRKKVSDILVLSRDVTYTKLSLGGKNLIISGQGEFGK